MPDNSSLVCGSVSHKCRTLGSICSGFSIRCVQRPSSVSNTSCIDITFSVSATAFTTCSIVACEICCSSNGTYVTTDALLASGCENKLPDSEATVFFGDIALNSSGSSTHVANFSLLMPGSILSVIQLLSNSNDGKAVNMRAAQL